MWTKALPYARLEREQRFVLSRPEGEIVIFLAAGKLYAFDNACPHQGMPLEDGLLDPQSGTLTCVYHDWCFKLEDGRGHRQTAGIKPFAVKVEDGYVWVET